MRSLSKLSTAACRSVLVRESADHMRGRCISADHARGLRARGGLVAVRPQTPYLAQGLLTSRSLHGPGAPDFCTLEPCRADDGWHAPRHVTCRPSVPWRVVVRRGPVAQW